MNKQSWMIELLLPLADNTGKPFPRSMVRDVRAQLTERHGGVTAFLQA